MTTKPPPLTDVLYQLIGRPAPEKRKLSKGLALAYTPGALNEAEPGTHRLTLSRHGTWPSDKEEEVS